MTLSREAAGWDVSCSGAQVPTQPLPPTGKETGIDVGLQGLLLTAHGEAVAHPRPYRKAEQAVTKAQPRRSRRKSRKKRSQRWWKAVRLVAKQHQQVQRQRRDFPHQTALALLRQYDPR